MCRYFSNEILYSPLEIVFTTTSGLKYSISSFESPLYEAFEGLNNYVIKGGPSLTDVDYVENEFNNDALKIYYPNRPEEQEMYFKTNENIEKLLLLEKIMGRVECYWLSYFNLSVIKRWNCRYETEEKSCPADTTIDSESEWNKAMDITTSVSVSWVDKYSITFALDLNKTHINIKDHIQQVTNSLLLLAINIFVTKNLIMPIIIKQLQLASLNLIAKLLIIHVL